MDKEVKAKELKSNPFKIKNKMDKEKEVIQKIIDTTTKKVVASELFETLNKEFEKLLLSTKDAIQAHVRGNVLEELGYTDAAKLFNLKAIELGYVVESKKMNENMTDTPRKFIVIGYNEDFEDTDVSIVNNAKSVEHVEMVLELDFFQLSTQEELRDVEDRSRYQDYIDHNPYKIVELDNADVIDAGDYMFEIEPEYPLSDQNNSLHNSASDEYRYFKLMLDNDTVKVVKVLTDEVGNESTDVVQYAMDHHAILPEDFDYENKDITNRVTEVTKDDFMTANDLNESKTNESTTSADLYNKLVTKYSNLSEILKDNLMSVTNEYDNGNVSPETKQTVINAIAAIVEDTKENIEALVNENHKQQFIYSPQEEKKYKIDEDAPVEKKLEYNPIALRHMISDDAFLKFSFHNLSVGNEEEDLKLIYNTYIKDEENMMSKLKTYESYTEHVLRQKQK